MVKLLREYIREILLTEVAKGPQDLPDHMRVEIKSAGDYFTVTLMGTVADPRLDDPTAKERRLGTLSAKHTGHEALCMGAYIIDWANVSSLIREEGWGPMLYDVAMEYATSKGSGLMSDRSDVSSDAFGVWQYYADQRGDVEKVQMDDVDDRLTPDITYDNCEQASVYADANLPGSTTSQSGEWHEEVDGPWDPRGKDILLNHPLSKMYKAKGTPTISELESLGKLEMK